VDILTFISELVKSGAWPMAFVLVSFYILKKCSVDNLKSFLASIETRKIRAKIGSAEIELGEIEKLRKTVQEVAEEVDPKKDWRWRRNHSR